MLPSGVELKQWIHNHPTEAVFLSLAAGLAVGGFISTLSGGSSGGYVEASATPLPRHVPSESVSPSSPGLPEPQYEPARRQYVPMPYAGLFTGIQEAGMEGLARIGEVVQQGIARGLSARLKGWIARIGS